MNTSLITKLAPNPAHIDQPVDDSARVTDADLVKLVCRALDPRALEAVAAEIDRERGRPRPIFGKTIRLIAAAQRRAVAVVDQHALRGGVR